MSDVRTLFRCPACGVTHAVNAARASVAYGRQLTCSPECESAERQRMRGEVRRSRALPCGAESSR
jgi:hypothetical protein